jgi:hypothetical protein
MYTYVTTSKGGVTLLQRKIPPLMPDLLSPIPVETATARRPAPSAMKRVLTALKEKAGKKSPERELERPAYWFF